MPRGRKKVTDGEIAVAMIKHKGSVSDVAIELKLNTETIYRRMKKNPNIKAKMKNADEVLVDKAIKGLGKLVDDTNLNAIKYVLDNKGRERGYGIKQVESENLEADTSNKQLNLTGMSPDAMKLLLDSLNKSKRIEEKS